MVTVVKMSEQEKKLVQIKGDAMQRNTFISPETLGCLGSNVAMAMVTVSERFQIQLLKE